MRCLITVLILANAAAILPADDFPLRESSTLSTDPMLAGSSAGTFLAVWGEENGDGDSVLQGLTLSSDGSILSGPFEVAPPATGASQRDPEVIAAGAGFLVVWRELDTLTTVRARSFTAQGSPLEDPFQVSPPGQSVAGPAHPASLEDLVALAWWADGCSWIRSGVFGQAWAPGVATQDCTLVDDLALVETAGDPVAVFGWSHFFGFSDVDNYLRHLALDGSPLGDASIWTRQANPFRFTQLGPSTVVGVAVSYGILSGAIFGTMIRPDGELGFSIRGINEGRGSRPRAAALGDGVAVAWACENVEIPGNRNWDICARRFAADATPIGDEYRRVNTQLEGDQTRPAVATTDGATLVIWRSTDTSGQTLGVFGSLLATFLDGFETGGSAGWSNTVP